MQFPRYHANILIDSRERPVGSEICDFTYTLNSSVVIPDGSTAFLKCVRWVVDVRGIQGSAQDTLDNKENQRKGRSVQMHISEIDPAGQFIDMKNGKPSACVAYIPTINTSYDVARVSSLETHAVKLPSGLNTRRLSVKLLDKDGDLFEELGEWEAVFQLVVYRQ